MPKGGLKTQEAEYGYLIQAVVEYQTGEQVQIIYNKDRSRIFSVEAETRFGVVIQYSCKLEPVEKYDRIEAIKFAFVMSEIICDMLQKSPRSFKFDERGLNA